MSYMRDWEKRKNFYLSYMNIMKHSKQSLRRQVMIKLTAKKFIKIT